MISGTRTRVAVLGSTGSIGRQALDVMQAQPDRFEVVALVAGTDEQTLRAQTVEMGSPRSGLGREAALEAATAPDVDLVLNSIVGAAGLEASLAALSTGKTLALANKESLVAGGELCLAAARAGGGDIVPVDSEHAALSQCLAGVEREDIDAVVITASGGPFRERDDLASVTREDALAHPTWNMGSKITIDSATLFNKGLEVIEAHFLFDFSYDEIDVLVHPQSLVHAMVRMVDGSSIMQAGPTDMRIPIAWALSGARGTLPPAPLDFTEAVLTFEHVDRSRFPALDLAYAAGRSGGTAPAVLNAAKEEAVGAFLQERIGFTDMPKVVEAVLAEHRPEEAGTLEAVLEVDTWARGRARSVMAEAFGRTRETTSL